MKNFKNKLKLRCFIQIIIINYILFIYPKYIFIYYKYLLYFDQYLFKFVF